jgi:hypothetical protein
VHSRLRSVTSVTPSPLWRGLWRHDCSTVISSSPAVAEIELARVGSRTAELMTGTMRNASCSSFGTKASSEGLRDVTLGERPIAAADRQWAVHKARSWSMEVAHQKRRGCSLPTSRSSASLIVKLEPMLRFHFHLFDGRDYVWDADGVLLPDLTAVVAEAEARARLIMSTRTDIHGWTTWMIDVRGNDDITLFHYPFAEIAKAA